MTWPARGSCLLAAAAWLALSACDGPTPPEVSEAPPGGLLPVEALVVESVEGYQVRDAFAGRVVSRRSSDLGFERGGRLDRVDVDEGDRVEAGQVLAELEHRQLVARRRELQARVRETDSRLALARLTTARRKGLIERESISAQRYDEAVHEERALGSQLAAARAALEGVRVELELSSLHAPYAGVVTARQADEGTVVAPGQTILRLIEDGAMEFRVGLPPQAAGRLDAERSYAVEVGGRRFEAQLHAVVPSVEPNTRTVGVVLRFESPPDGVGHGSLGRLTLETQIDSRGLWLPISALTESRRGLWSAYVLAQDSGENGDAARVERRELQVLHTESDRVFVRGTLRDGERVAAGGLHRLVPGQRVRVVH